MSGWGWMRQFEMTRRLFHADITAQALQFVGGLHVSVFGGTRPHIGAVSVASPAGQVVTTQFPAHRDGVISDQWSKALSKAGYCPNVVEVGIHYDDLNKSGIDAVLALTNEMLNTVLLTLSKSQHT